MAHRLLDRTDAFETIPLDRIDFKRLAQRHNRQPNPDFDRLQFQHGPDLLLLEAAMVEGGVIVQIERNGKSVVRPVSDVLLAKHIGYGTYQVFHELARRRREPIRRHDFDKRLLDRELLASSIEEGQRQLENVPTNNFIGLWRELKLNLAMILAVIAEFEWYTHQEDSILLTTQSNNLQAYINAALPYIGQNSPMVVSEMTRELQRRFRIFSGLLANRRITIGYGVDPPDAIAPDRSNNSSDDDSEAGLGLLWILIVAGLILLIIWLFERMISMGRDDAAT